MQVPAPPSASPRDDFRVQTEQFADVKVLRYQVPGFDGLSLPQKRLAYYLYQAALSGRDITWDQHFGGNLRVRKTFEAILTTHAEAGGPPPAVADASTWEAFATYAKRVFVAGGIHHHASTEKLAPDLTGDQLRALVLSADPSLLPLDAGQAPEDLAAWLAETLLNPDVAPWGRSPSGDGDLLAGSANHFYRGVTQAEAEAFYAARVDPADPRPVSHGLNSQLVKDPDGTIRERTWKVGGMYGPAIERIVSWLEKAQGVAENDQQRAWIGKLVDFYRTGELRTFDEMNIAWLREADVTPASRIDAVNGFIEVYGDALAMRGTYESVVSLRDLDASQRMAAISGAAPWFEAHSPIDDAHRKPDVRGISAKVITVIVGGGDTSPTFPIGINLPNAEWIRKEHGSKSVNLGNIVAAYERANKASGLLEEFCADEATLAREKAHGDLSDRLHTDLHEVIGHGSGRLEPGVGVPAETLKSYASVLEEARADLVALYFLMDPKLMELGVMDTLEVGRAAYDGYIRNGLLTQLARLKPGDTLQQAHMRNRQLIAGWAFERGRQGGVIEKIERGGHYYFAVRDHDALRGLFGELLREVQRVKSQGDYEAGRALVETYGVQVDQAVHADVLARYEKLGIAPYSAFINPRLVPVTDEAGDLQDVRVEYPDDFLGQMLEYGRDYALLPWDN